MSCPICGSQLPNAARFCSVSGRPQYGPADERRIATVLFADIVDTWAATRDAVRYAGLGPVRAGGRDERFDAWLAVEPLGPPGYRPRRPRAPLVGRDEEVALVGQALATCMARAGTPGVAAR